MSAFFEELDFKPTQIGGLSLRRRKDLRTGEDMFEIKLGDEFLMSSGFTASEEALGRLGVEAAEGTGLSIVVGGLGLGYTARAVLESERVGALVVVDMLQPVIDWHREGLLPLGPGLVADARCRFVQGDFFACAASEAGFDPDEAGPDEVGRRFDAVLVDIDHSPDALLDDGSASFYRPEGLAGLIRHLVPGGIFGLWSNEPPDPRFTDRLAAVFAEAWAEEVRFPNPYLDREEIQTVYLARTARSERARG
jgi:spermidine synthase